jgi:6,7-dimethyl-8-ribityllumazine synthase
MKEAPGGRPSAEGLRVAVVSAAFNRQVVAGLEAGAREALLEMGARPQQVQVVTVPGALELPIVARAAAVSGRFDAIVALGAVIAGETDHYEHVAREASAGLAAVARETGIPVGFGVLTVREEAQALRRSQPGPGNKGAEAARAAIATVHALRAVAPAPRRARTPVGLPAAHGRRPERPRRRSRGGGPR